VSSVWPSPAAPAWRASKESAAPAGVAAGTGGVSAPDAARHIARDRANSARMGWIRFMARSRAARMRGMRSGPGIRPVPRAADQAWTACGMVDALECKDGQGGSTAQHHSRWGSDMGIEGEGIEETPSALISCHTE
jgi:hypothetical protein